MVYGPISLPGPPKVSIIKAQGLYIKLQELKCYIYVYIHSYIHFGRVRRQGSGLPQKVKLRWRCRLEEGPCTPRKLQKIALTQSFQKPL